MDAPDDTFKQAKLKKILSEDGTLMYDFMTSLQKITMARIVSTLWMDQNIQQQIVDLFHRYRCVTSSDFFGIEQDICAKILELSLPNSICQGLTDLVSVLKDVLFNWIAYHDEHIFSTEKSGYSAANLIHNITWTARGKIDYLQTVKNILANTNNDLSDDHKYRLACTYCLEDQIALFSSDLVKQCNFSYLKIDKYPMVYFWTTQISGDMTQFSNPSYYSNRYQCYRGDMSINEHIMQLLIKNCSTMNDVPIRFMWNKLNKEEKTKNIALIFEKVVNRDFIIALLANLEYDEQQNVLKEHSDAVFYVILEDWWWWGDYFLPTALNVLDIMSPACFWKVLDVIYKKMCSRVIMYDHLHRKMCLKKEIYDNFKHLFKRLWQVGSIQVKEFILYDNGRPLIEYVTSVFDWARDMDVIEVILNNLNAEQKKNIAFHEICIEKCALRILRHECDVVDNFIKHALSSEEDINQLKQKLIQDSGREIAISFLNRGIIHKMESFVKWAFESEEDIYNFRKSLNYAMPPFTQ